MRRVHTGLAAGVILIAALTACSGSGSGGDDNDPTPVGGINGPARVDPDSGGANNSGGD